MSVSNNKKGMRWPKNYQHKWRKSVHYEDPIVVRECPFCSRKHEWPISQTSAGQEMYCRCGGVFNSWNNPSWFHPGKSLRDSVKKV